MDDDSRRKPFAPVQVWCETCRRDGRFTGRHAPHMVVVVCKDVGKGRLSEVDTVHHERHERVSCGYLSSAFRNLSNPNKNSQVGHHAHSPRYRSDHPLKITLAETGNSVGKGLLLGEVREATDLQASERNSHLKLDN